MGCINLEIDGNPVCNFTIELYRIIDIYNGCSHEPIRHVEFRLNFNGDPPGQKKRVLLSQLRTIDWSKLDYRAVLFTGMASTATKCLIAERIWSSLEPLPIVSLYQLDHPGFYNINDTALFCAGAEVIRPPASGSQEPEVECVPMSQYLDFDPALSVEEAAAEMLNLISLFPNPGRIILAQVLVAFMRQIYEEIDIRPSFCVFLYGPTGTQKTTIASFLTQIYNRNAGMAALPRLNTSQASAIELLLDTTDQVLVFDDLFPSSSGQLRKKQEETLSEITRYIGDGTIPARIRGNKLRMGQPRCGVLFTGEYLIGEGSDAARLLPVEMTKPDTAALSRFQEKPLVVSTLYRNFIIWVVNNYDEIVAYLKEWLDEYRRIDLGIHDRLRETHFFLNSAYALFLEYCGDIGVLSQEEIERFHDDFLTQLTKLVREQNERVCPTSSVLPQQGDVLERIRELYQNGQFSIPRHKSQFDGGVHHGVIHKNCLCLRPEALSHFFPSMDPDEIAAELEAKGALNKPKNGYKRKISEAKGNHFYWIPLASL